jgi:hypothetical protein
MDHSKLRSKASPHKPENPLVVLLCNIVLPVFILHQGAKHLGEQGPLLALIFALAIPLGYGLYDFRKRHKPNFVSIVGLVNVSITGSFAILHLEGDWFWYKEACFPFLIGTAIALFNRYNQPFLFTVFWNETLFQVEKIETRLAELNQSHRLDHLFRKASDLFSLSFFISGIGNFLLARRIFLPIDPSLEKAAHSQELNAQIARMTWQGYTMIALPMMAFMGLVLWYLIHGLKESTGYLTDDLLAGDPATQKPE